MKDKDGKEIKVDVTMSLTNGDPEKDPLHVSFSTDNISLLNIDNDTMVLSINDGSGISITVKFNKSVVS